MRIAYITTSFPNLSTTFILNQITGLIDLGHLIEIFAITADQDLVHPDVKTYNLLEKTTYLNSPKSGLERKVDLIKLLFKSRNLSIFVKQLFLLMKSINERNNLLYVVNPFLNKKEFDIIHCHFGRTGTLLSKIIDFIPHKLFITSFYGYDVSSYIELKISYDLLCKKGDAFLPLCNDMKNKLLSLGFPESKIFVHPLGVDPCKFELKHYIKNERKNVNILTVARLVEKKGIKYALEALAKVISRIKVPIKYNIIGDGELKGALIEQSCQLGLENIVKFLGWKTQQEVIEYFNKADIFLLPSVTAANGDQEGTPTVLLEAQAVGIPVVSTFHSGIPEIVENGRSGFLVPEKDSDALAEKIIYLIDHSNQWATFGKYGRSFVEKRFDVQKLNARLADIYNQLLN